MSKAERLGQGPYFIKSVYSSLYESMPKIKLDHDFIIFGRSMEADVYIKEDEVSKCHAILMKTSSAWYLIDFNSRNGVFVNHQKIISKSAYRLVEGDTFSLGPSVNISFMFGRHKPEDCNGIVKCPDLSPKVPEIRIAKLYDKIAILENELALKKQVEDETRALKMDIENLRDELQSKTDSFETRLCQAVEVETEDLQNVISQLKESCEAKAQIEATLNQRITVLMEENANYLKELEKMQELKDTNVLNCKTIANLRIESARHEYATLGAHEEIAVLKSEMEKLTNSYETSSEALRQSDLIILEKQMEIERLENEYEALISANETEIKRLQNENRAAISENKVLSNEMSKMELRITTRNENLIRENKALIIKNKNFSAQITQLNQKVSLLSNGQGPGNKHDLQDMQHHVNLIMEHELNCSICSEFFVNAVTLGCTHVFCQFCISSWKKKKVDCPTCRNPIKTEALSPVIDNFINKMVLYLPNDIKTQRDKIIQDRATKMPVQQQPQRKVPIQPRVQSRPANEWQQVGFRRPAAIAPSHASSRGPRNAFTYNPPPRLQRQNYGQAATSQSNRYDLDVF